MIATLEGSIYTVTATNRDVCDFAATWPCHGLDTDCEYVFQFSASTGDIVDVNAIRDSGQLEATAENEDGEALKALSEEAGRYGAEQLGLQDVLSIRYGDVPAPR